MSVSVCVIIAAWNAERTISRAVDSALVQPEVSEVIVIDDASNDSTAESAAASDDGSGRLQVLRQTINSGPSAARNRALTHARAEYIAVLDADDYLLPGRFAALLAIPGWDAIADNIAFFPEDLDEQGVSPKIADFFDGPRELNLAAFLTGAMTLSGRSRGELGFLKPLIRRSFLEGHCLRYDETLRLSEDFMLYVQMLAAGARFMTWRRCGYVAVERAVSLSGAHTTADLDALLAAVDRWRGNTSLDAAGCSLMGRYRAQLSANYRHRRLLDDKRTLGTWRALAKLMDEPAAAPRVAGRIVRDKLARWTSVAAPPAGVRYLLCQ